MVPVFNDAYRFAPAAPHEEHVFGASSPGWHSAASQEASVAEWVSFMQDNGVDRVCCLVPGEEAETGTLDRYREAFGKGSVRHAPVPAFRLIGEGTLRADVLPFLRATSEARERVVVHGLSGLGHTGQVLAAWLVAGHEYRPHEAVDTVRQMGRDPTETVEMGTGTRHELLTLLGEFA